MSARRIFPLPLFVLLTVACTGIPEHVSPVTGFDVSRYLGTWYEIARLDHSFERGLEQVTAEYSLRADGGIRVVNRGFDPAGNRWKEADGKAYFIGPDNVGRLKVSFFGPFYGAYNIIELDKQDYRYALVCGPNEKYLWILAREPVLDKATMDRLTATASALGFETDRLIFVSQTAAARPAVTE
jgi:apolipoprotein D and lipocalin family protein